MASFKRRQHSKLIYVVQVTFNLYSALTFVFGLGLASSKTIYVIQVTFHLNSALNFVFAYLPPKLVFVVQVTSHLYSAFIFVFGPNLVSSETSLRGSGNISSLQYINVCV